MRIVIIGNGISGITAARFIRKLSDHEITIVSAETEHFFSRTALMYIYMGHMRYEDTKPYEDWFWEKNRINLVYDFVKSVNTAQQTLQLSHATLNYDKLIIATGSKSNKFGWPGQDLKAVAGLYSYQDLEEMEKYSLDLDRAVIVGGGLIGIEMAEMFHSRDIPVTMLVRENNYWDNVLPTEEATMISHHIKEHHIDLRLGYNLQEIIDDGHGRAAGVVVKETGERIDCGFVGLTAGVSPNIGFLASSGIEADKGVKVNKYMETSAPNVYAIGDCAERIEPVPGRRSIEAVWYTGRMMGETVAYNVCGKRLPYKPGIWFNSAKFLDIEYQVYGTVLNKPADNHLSLYWQHRNGKHSVRIIYDKESLAVIGFNLLGIRYRQEICEQWIKSQTHIEQVLQDLPLANFDPELCNAYEADILAQYNKSMGKQITLKKKRGLSGVLQYLSRQA